VKSGISNDVLKTCIKLRGTDDFKSAMNDVIKDIRDAMRVADEEMYKDKERYYKEHPERKYR